MRHVLTVILALLPVAVLAAPTIVIQPGGEPSVRYVRSNAASKPTPEDRMRAFEEREIKRHIQQPTPLTAEEAEALIDKKNKELLEKLQADEKKAAPFKDPEGRPEESPFGKVGGLGAVGGIGTVDSPTITENPSK